LASRSPGLASCELARVEFTCIVQRHLRETNITAREARETDDRHMLAGCGYFDLAGVNVLNPAPTQRPRREGPRRKKK
jgi:hypothetical protein